ncbi:MAG: hypothetical protein ACI4I6_04960 [Hominimerdicola sp.]
MRDELGSEIDCMKIIKKEIARQKSLEDGENGNEMKNEFDSLEKAVETEISNLNELKKRMSIFRKKFFQPKIDNNNNQFNKTLYGDGTPDSSYLGDSSHSSAVDLGRAGELFQSYALKHGFFI